MRLETEEEEKDMAEIKVLLAVVVVSLGTREGGGRRWKSGEFIGKVNLAEGSGGIFCSFFLFYERKKWFQRFCSIF